MVRRERKTLKTWWWIGLLDTLIQFEEQVDFHWARRIGKYPDGGWFLDHRHDVRDNAI